MDIDGHFFLDLNIHNLIIFITFIIYFHEINTKIYYFELTLHLKNEILLDILPTWVRKHLFSQLMSCLSLYEVHTLLYVLVNDVDVGKVNNCEIMMLMKSFLGNKFPPKY